MARKHQPCRVCGADHINPASSSICVSCGIQQQKENLAREISDYELTPEERIAALEDTIADMEEHIEQIEAWLVRFAHCVHGDYDRRMELIAEIEGVD
jgi:SMC interacting uncharacterized protein involved in chromosome segregation